MAAGRPGLYSDKMTDAICLRLSEGESLRAICADKKMPALTTVQRWLAEPANEAFRTRYARAREHQADYFADQIVEISDAEDNPQKARIRIDARKWKAAKMRPRVYGDKVQTEQGGEYKFTIQTGVPRADD